MSAAIGGAHPGVGPSRRQPDSVDRYSPYVRFQEPQLLVDGA
jgi:hypothetical protein